MPADVHPVVDGPYTNRAPWINQEVVISGMSGRLPQANSIEEFKQNLYNGVDMVTENEKGWPAGELFSRNLFLLLSICGDYHWGVLDS